MKRTFFCNCHLVLCTLLWAQSLVGQTTSQYEGAKPGEGKKPGEDARPGEAAKPGEGAKQDTSAWLSEKPDAKPGDGARPGEDARPGEGESRAMVRGPAKARGAMSKNRWS